MKKCFSLKTAWHNIQKNYRFYIPQMLTGTGLLACLYIVYTLSVDERVTEIRGGDYLPIFMRVGAVIIALLSVILVLYTNSFLMRQRKREYGLYNVLGLEKRHIGRILFWETAFSGGISVMGGVVFGLLFYKICSLLICAILQADVIFGFDYITINTILPPVLFFVVLYLIAFAVNRIGIAKLKPVEMMASRQMGEREPKVKWPVFLLGLLTLGGGYTIAVITKNPLAAILLFFVAVFLVIIGTYCLFTAGSVFVLKALKNNKRYYYRPHHMPNIAGLLFRMKQNAVGLASICILSTGVLVMISSTVSLYSGMADTLQKNYPEDMYILCEYYDTQDGQMRPVPTADLEKLVRDSAQKNGVTVKRVDAQRYLRVTYQYDGAAFLTNGANEQSTRDTMDAIYIPEDEYAVLTGRTLGLEAGEIAVIPLTANVPFGTTLEIHGVTYRVRVASDFPITPNSALVSYTTVGVVLPDEETLQIINAGQTEAYGEDASRMTERLAVTFDDRAAVEPAAVSLRDDIFDGFDGCVSSQPDYDGRYHYSYDDYWGTKESMVGMYGSLLFLGIILGLVCLFATVLIIYYKQISEGYEDRERWQIMKKVGMSNGEICKTVRSQTLSVFFLPLLAAGVHTCFAFPLINRLLHLFMLSATRIFVYATLLTYVLFALTYVVIYLMTARTYYKIVQ